MNFRSELILDRVILHVDMDAFFAAVEVLDNPDLKGMPVIVGGVSERGVVSTCSYEARRFGVRSAMPVFIAREKCPNAIFVPVRHWRYAQISKEIFNILYSITDKVEQVSIDEGYLDITHINKPPVKVAMEIKRRIKSEIGLTISVGISYNKFLAKLASDWNKPDGLKVITREMVPKVLFPLPIKKVHGLGNKSVERLNNIGVYTVEDLYKFPLQFFYEYFGKFGVEIYERIRGEDNREVTVERERKSIGRETTLSNDTNDKEELKKYIEEFSYDIEEYLKRENMKGKTVTLKIKTSSFENHTKSKTLNRYVDGKEEIFKEGCNILESVELHETLRLIGLSVSTLKDEEVEQLTLF